jgi:hypothetical protein
MSKLIDFLRRNTPSDPVYSFADPVTVYDANGNIIYTTPYGRTSPNAFKPDASIPFTPAAKKWWDKCYGLIALGVYDGDVINHPKHGKCISINGGKEVSAALPNPNHNGRHVVSEGMIHCSDNDRWPGSAGCLTVRKSEWKGFMKLFRVGETVKIQIRGIA